ncbi:MAG TPA: molybdate ABC transporter substrate-binding protein [Clostridium sp.]
MNYKKLFCTGVSTIMALTVLMGCGSSTKEENYEGKNILVYCAAGVNKPMEEIGQVFKEKYKATVDFTYANSTELISQMEITKKGDICVLASGEDYESANTKNLITEKVDLVKHIPAIAVPKGNPKGITSLKDFGKDGVKIIIGDQNVTPLGKLANKLFEKQGVLDTVQKNIVATFSTVNEVVTFLSMGKGDCSIVWEDNILNASSDLDLIPIPENENLIKTVPICTLESSQEKDLAKKFMDFAKSDEAKEIFKKYNLKPIE